MFQFKNDMIEAAASQLAADFNCMPQDFMKTTFTVTRAQLLPGRRRFQDSRHFFYAGSFGNGAVASVSPEIYAFTQALLEKVEGLRVFDAQGIYVINKELEKYGKAIEAFKEYYLPRMPYGYTGDNAYRTEVYEGEALTRLYELKPFQNALLFQNQDERRDVLAVAVKNADTIIGLAGASNDSDRFWQIGVDVLPEFRHKGVAHTAVSILTREVLMRGAIPYYGTWWANVASRNVALRCGYYPAWVEMFAVDVY